MKVALVAEHSSIDFGGEAALPCHYFREYLKLGIDVRLLVHGRSRKFLEKHFPDAQERICYVEDTTIQRLLHRFQKPLPHRIAYFTLGFLSRQITQYTQKRVLKRWVAERQVEIIHQIIPVSPKEPSSLYSLGVPVVIGPMNGGMTFPPAFSNYDGRATRLFAYMGRQVSNAVNRLIPGKLKADALLVANQRTKDALPKDYLGRVFVVPENGVDESIWKPRMNSNASSQEIRFLYVGRFVDWKGVDMLIDSFCMATDCRTMHLTLVGDGPSRNKLEQQATDAKLMNGSTISFTGWQPQSKIAQLLCDATALILPSLYECGGAVVLEAMACAVPVIATDWGGPATYINPDCGVLVKPESRKHLVDGFATAMQKLAIETTVVSSMAAAAERRAVTFRWSEKAKMVLDIYSELVR